MFRSAAEIRERIWLGRYLMWDSGLEPRFLAGSLREPRPDCRDVQDA